ncbi:hypothetical protein CH298_13355 [Rhodococcoides fascians]|uniref:hypothetical protein n=1 Tax=Rhodococcoides fascians TaxID=1828 RepID=UPI000B9BF236|nr:hypothetical protein [Rhodococcus fascians]OZE89966.1 hypothetical protein CH303_13235 [Rhodococcus fascians]OZF18273.1 hypothetical protein CH298_13355 [Rhodococcus fascians]OZF21724.1 hypothetical protein CH297_13250 [Rhodococcus fascians]OZF67349.1 hypothetical protein CH308_13150 [Rhodococcus fascians]OZF70538.1 hypothetical protein CH307_13345 [Rhodococcus fascians]
MSEEVGYFALDAGQQIHAPIVITEGGIAIGGTAVPGIILDGEVVINPIGVDPSNLRTVTVKFAAEGGVVLNAGLGLDPQPDGSIRVSSRPGREAPTTAEGAGPPPPDVSAT